MVVDEEMRELIAKREARAIERSRRATSGVIGNPVEVGSSCEEGSIAEQGCTSCYCQDGTWACENVDCDGECCSV